MAQDRLAQRYADSHRLDAEFAHFELKTKAPVEGVLTPHQYVSRRGEEKSAGVLSFQKAMGELLLKPVVLERLMGEGILREARIDWDRLTVMRDVLNEEGFRRKMVLDRYVVEDAVKEVRSSRLIVGHGREAGLDYFLFLCVEDERRKARELLFGDRALWKVMKDTTAIAVDDPILFPSYQAKSGPLPNQLLLLATPLRLNSPALMEVDQSAPTTTKQPVEQETKNSAKNPIPRFVLDAVVINAQHQGASSSNNTATVERVSSENMPGHSAAPQSTRPIRKAKSRTVAKMNKAGKTGDVEMADASSAGVLGDVDTNNGGNTPKCDKGKGKAADDAVGSSKTPTGKKSDKPDLQLALEASKASYASQEKNPASGNGASSSSSQAPNPAPDTTDKAVLSGMQSAQNAARASHATSFSWEGRTYQIYREVRSIVYACPCTGGERCNGTCRNPVMAGQVCVQWPRGVSYERMVRWQATAPWERKEGEGGVVVGESGQLEAARLVPVVPALPKFEVPLIDLPPYASPTDWASIDHPPSHFTSIFSKNLVILEASTSETHLSATLCALDTILSLTNVSPPIVVTGPELRLLEKIKSSFAMPPLQPNLSSDSDDIPRKEADKFIQLSRAAQLHADRGIPLISPADFATYLPALPLDPNSNLREIPAPKYILLSVVFNEDVEWNADFKYLIRQILEIGKMTGEMRLVVVFIDARKEGEKEGLGVEAELLDCGFEGGVGVASGTV